MKQNEKSKFEYNPAQIRQKHYEELAARFFPHITEPHGSALIKQLMEIEAAKKSK